MTRLVIIIGLSHSLTGPLPVRVAGGGGQDVQAGVHVVAGAGARAAAAAVALTGTPPGPRGLSLCHRGGGEHPGRVREENPFVLNLRGSKIMIIDYTVVHLVR